MAARTNTFEIGKAIIGSWLVDAWIYRHDAHNFYWLGMVVRIDGRRGGTNRKVGWASSLDDAKKMARTWYERTVPGVQRSVERNMAGASRNRTFSA